MWCRTGGGGHAVAGGHGRTLHARGRASSQCLLSCLCPLGWPACALRSLIILNAAAFAQRGDGRPALPCRAHARRRVCQGPQPCPRPGPTLSLLPAFVCRYSSPTRDVQGGGGRPLLDLIGHMHAVRVNCRLNFQFLATQAARMQSGALYGHTAVQPYPKLGP